VSGGTLSKGSREYRTPPAVAPPQVPSHYAPNYPMGHTRRTSERGPGYSTLPMAPNQHHQAMSPPQVGMVHPLNVSQHSQQQMQQHPQTPPPPPPPVGSSYIDHHMSMPRTLNQVNTHQSQLIKVYFLQHHHHH
jgi:abl interactor 2